MTNFVILDLISNNYEEIDIYLSEFKNHDFLVLTPSAAYSLERNSIDFITFHDIIPVEKFRNKILKLYTDVTQENQNSSSSNAFLIEVAQQLCQLQFIDSILGYLKHQTFNSITYITDRTFATDSITLNNDYSNLLKRYPFSRVILITQPKQKKISKITLLKKYSLLELSKKVISKISNQRFLLTYDWFYIMPKTKQIITQASCVKYTFKIPDNFFPSISINKIEISVEAPRAHITNFLTFLGTNMYHQLAELKKQYPLYLFQHGSYLYQNIFIKYAEIEPATINFVFNDYTKQLFQDLGAKNVYSVGSILFNKRIKNRKKKYDYIYITQGHDYLGNLQYVDFLNSLHSFDGYMLYQRHNQIIELFGKKFNHKKLVIKVHPTVLTNGLYVPFWELVNSYENITIDVSNPVHTLIEKAQYIISDYFTSEFINRELHYQRDIILFSGAPTPLPNEITKDMEKIFILVNTVNNLQETIEKIEEITKNRIRDDAIIEYYSSKKCDTKKEVSEILQKGLF